MIDSCALLTTGAGSRIAALHHRMPVVLPPERYAAWLDPDTADPLALLEAPLEDWSYHRVGFEVNDPRKESPDLVREDVPLPADAEF